MRQKFVLLLLLICATKSNYAQQKDAEFIQKIFNQVMTNADAYENLRYLCKSIGPRLSGSAQAEKAISYVAQLLKTAGADSVYLQPCKVPKWVRGEKENASVVLKNGKTKILHVCALGNSIATPENGIIGEVVEINDIAALNQLGSAAIKGKIVFFNFPMNPLYVRTFMAYGESGVSRRDGPALASKYGAVGAIVRSLASNLDDFPHTGTTTYKDSFPKIPAIAISTNDAEWLSNCIREKQLLNLSFITNCKMEGEVLSSNVIGLLKGTDFPDEYITIGGHLDSWDLGEGAHDDGAGCMQSIEVIRTFTQLAYRPKYSLRVVLFMNEENGLKGGLAYADSARQRKENHLFALESDAGGFSPRGFAISTKSKNQQEKMKQWIQLLEPYDINQLSFDGGGADIGPLQSLGATIGDLRPDSQRYFDVHHAATDVFESVSRRELLLGCFAMSAWIYLVGTYGIN